MISASWGLNTPMDSMQLNNIHTWYVNEHFEFQI